MQIRRSKTIIGKRIYSTSLNKNMKKTATLFILMFFMTFTYASEIEIRKCAESESHADQRTCLSSLAKSVETKLRIAEAHAFEMIERWDEDVGYRSKSKQLLFLSITTFKKYRNEQCSFIHSLAAGGNGATDMRLPCSVELTEQRITQLNEFSSGLESR